MTGLEDDPSIFGEETACNKYLDLEFKMSTITAITDVEKTNLDQFSVLLAKQNKKLDIQEKINLMNWLDSKKSILFQLKSEIEKFENQIDNEVYKLYNLTRDEIKVIESSFND